MIYLEHEDFVYINVQTIKRHGGAFLPPSNLLHPSELDYLLDAVKGALFGEELYPKLEDKAALYMFSIISNHVFQDGNKRTGLGAALLFLRLNGKRLKTNLQSVVDNRGQSIPEEGITSNEILFHFTMEIASGKLSLDECRLWFSKNIEGVE